MKSYSTFFIARRTNLLLSFSVVALLLFVAPSDITKKKPFSIIILPDTQFYSEITANGSNSATGGTPAMLTAQIDWIIANRKKQNIVYVGQLGDCVQNGDNPPVAQKDAEWQTIQKAYAGMENKKRTHLADGIPYGLSVGNHDQSPAGDANGTTKYYNQYFGIDHFNKKKYYGGHYGINNDNHYELFTASGIKFLVLSLEYDQTESFSKQNGVLDWTESIVKKNSDRKIIILTHYAINEATVQPEFSTQGKAIYNRLKQYPNFILFLCGHICHQDGEAQRTDTYKENTVHTILSDYQCRKAGGNGLLRIMEFYPDENKVSVKTYSPYTNTYETDEDSQFELNVKLTH